MRDPGTVAPSSSAAGSGADPRSAAAGGESGAPPALPPGLFPPGTFPPGVDPATWRLDEVGRLLRRAAYLPMFSVPDPSRVNKPIPLFPWLPFALTAVEVHEELHRFDMEVELAAGCGGHHLLAHNRVGQPAARVHIRWTVIPERYAASPGCTPPTTVLFPFVSQRFAMMNGEMTFRDAAGSGFHAFGTGRTFPVVEAGKRKLRIGAVIDVLEGLGAFAGLAGTVVVNGTIEPPHGLALNLMLRFADPEGRLHAEGGLEALRPIPDPDPSATFLTFLGEPDPERGTELIVGPGGSMQGATVHERLRLVHLGFDLESGPPRSRVDAGPVVGNLAGRLYFNPFAAPPGSPVPFQTRHGVFSFHDRRGESLGTLRADVVEGRGFATELPGAPIPVFRFGGFGPVLGGDGAFAGAAGLMSLNAAISVFPRTLSNLYVFRLADPDGRFRRALGEGGR